MPNRGKVVPPFKLAVELIINSSNQISLIECCSITCLFLFAELLFRFWLLTNVIFFWSVFNQKALYNAYKKRTKNIECDVEEYNKLKESDPEFYRNASSLQYGKVIVFQKPKFILCVYIKTGAIYSRYFILSIVGAKGFWGENRQDG